MIVRSISDKHFDRVRTDFQFLVSRVEQEQGELDLRLRDDYFNLYYKGNSLAKVCIDHVPYQIEIHEKISGGVIKDERFQAPRKRGFYEVYQVDQENLHAFLSKANISRMYSRIKEIPGSEEITFEQLLIADNLNRSDLVIIDRQVQGGGLGRVRIDLLGLRQIGNDNTYQFEIIEVKLGNNPELRADVAGQLKKYVEIIEADFDDFKKCYERTYQQMKELGLLKAPDFKTVKIVKPVEGVIVVGGYPGLADKAMKELQNNHAGLKVKPFRNIL